jgi:hypothetical protein
MRRFSADAIAGSVAIVARMQRAVCRHHADGVWG